MPVSIEEARQCIYGGWFRWNSRMIYFFDLLESDSSTGKLSVKVADKSFLSEYEYELKCVGSTLKLRIEQTWYTVITLDRAKKALKIVQDDTGKEVLFTNAHSYLRPK
jgi:hypothetical protein